MTKFASSVKTVYNEEEASALLDRGYKLFNVFQYKEYAYNHQHDEQRVHDVYLAYTLVKKERITDANEGS